VKIDIPSLISAKCRTRALETDKRFSGQSDDWREGYKWALHEVAEHDEFDDFVALEKLGLIEFDDFVALEKLGLI